MMRIVHISDLHLSDGYYLPILSENMRGYPLIITEDMTMEGYPQEFEHAREYIDSLRCKAWLVVLGNHDSHNAGYELFQEIFGVRHSVYNKDNLIVVGIDFTKPDLDGGHIGREKCPFIKDDYLTAERVYSRDFCRENRNKLGVTQLTANPFVVVTMIAHKDQLVKRRR